VRFRARDGERAQAPGAHVLEDSRPCWRSSAGLRRDQRGERRRAALVRHVHDAGAGAQLEELAREMLAGARAGRRIVQGAGPLAREGDQLLQRARRQRCLCKNLCMSSCRRRT